MGEERVGGGRDREKRTGEGRRAGRKDGDGDRRNAANKKMCEINLQLKTREAVRGAWFCSCVFC